MDKKQIKYGLFLAAIVNIAGVLLFSQLFTNTALNNADPVVMSNFGLTMIMVWGLAYFGTALNKGNIKWIVSAFVVEKLVYVVVWVKWLVANSLMDVYGQDILAGIFYTIYGLNDFLFMLFFIYIITSELGWTQRFVKVS